MGSESAASYTGTSRFVPDSNVQRQGATYGFGAFGLEVAWNLHGLAVPNVKLPALYTRVGHRELAREQRVDGLGDERSLLSSF